MFLICYKNITELKMEGFDSKDSQLKCSQVIIWMFVIDLKSQRTQFIGVSLCIQS
jgi:hypothetical protein